MNLIIVYTLLSENLIIPSSWYFDSHESRGFILHITHITFFCNIIILLRFEAAEHPEIWLQYVIHGYMNEWYKVMRASLLRQCLALIIMPTPFEISLRYFYMTFYMLPIVTPINLVSGTCSVTWFSICNVTSHLYFFRRNTIKWVFVFSETIC